MITQRDLAYVLKTYHNALPEGADLAAKLILDHTSATGSMPLETLIAQSKSAYPLFFKADVPAAPEPTPAPEPVVAPAVAVAPAAVEPPPVAAPSRPLSITERIAIAARGGEQVSEDEIRAAFNKALNR